MIKLSENIRNKILDILLPEGFYFAYRGYCNCCDQFVTFKSYKSWLRDNFLCSNCRSIPRERALMYVIETYYPDWRNLDIHEFSPSERGASKKLREQAKKYKSSQYYPNNPKGLINDSLYNEDLEYLTFDNESFDLLISQDVFEHIYHPDRAFKEIARTLKKGGAHIFTVPIVNKHKPSEAWSVKSEDNKPVFLYTPEMHENPANSEGSPVTMHWGYDIVDYIKEKSGLDTMIEYIDNLDYGIRAELIEVCVSKKRII